MKEWVQGAPGNECANEIYIASILAACNSKSTDRSSYQTTNPNFKTYIMDARQISDHIKAVLAGTLLSPRR
jgi:hypothetical protein